MRKKKETGNKVQFTKNEKEIEREIAECSQGQLLCLPVWFAEEGFNSWAKLNPLISTYSIQTLLLNTGLDKKFTNRLKLVKTTDACYLLLHPVSNIYQFSDL